MVFAAFALGVLATVLVGLLISAGRGYVLQRAATRRELDEERERRLNALVRETVRDSTRWLDDQVHFTRQELAKVATKVQQLERRRGA